MRRSFGPNMGGGSGGGMLKSVHRAVRAGMGGPQESYSHSAATTTTGGNRIQPINTTLTLSTNTTHSSPCSNYLNHHPAGPDAQPWAFATASEDLDWQYISDGDSVNGCYDDVVFGSVPSHEEVHHAVSCLHEVLEPVSFARLMNYGSDDDGVEKISCPTGLKKPGFELDWTEPSMQLCYSTSALQVPSSDKVLDAFHLLQSEPSVQRMVISLSSDKAVWDAVMNNEVVRELRESISEDKSIHNGLDGSDDDSNPVTQLLRWIFVNTKDKMVEIVEKITKVVNELIQPVNNDEKPKSDADVDLDLFHEKLRNSFFLSVVVLLILVVSRSGKCHDLCL